MSPAAALPLPFPARRLSSRPGGETPLALSWLHLSALRDDLASGEFGPAALLRPAELARFHGYRYPKRQLEWLGGRWAAKHAATMLWPESAPGDWEVGARADGRPYFRPNPRFQPVPELSISHSHNLAAALAVTGQRAGLDLQRLSDTVLRVREKFCRTPELAILGSGEAPPGSEVEGLTLLWTAKEALRKGLGGHPLPGFLAMELVAVEKLADRAWLLTVALSSGASHPIAAWWLEDYAVALTVLT